MCNSGRCRCRWQPKCWYNSVYEKTDKDWNKIVKSLPMIQAIVWNSYLPFFNWECFCFCMLASTIFWVDLICLSHAATRTLTLDTPDRRVSQWGQKFYEDGFHPMHVTKSLWTNLSSYCTRTIINFGLYFFNPLLYTEVSVTLSKVGLKSMCATLWEQIYQKH